MARPSVRDNPTKGTQTAFSRDGYDKGSTMYRSAPGAAEPTAFAPLPTAHDDHTYNHTINFVYDTSGNAFVTRSNNNYGTESLFLLETGSDTWDFIIDTPGLVDYVLVRNDGTVLSLDGGLGRTVHILE